MKLRRGTPALTPEDVSPVIKQAATTLAFAFALYIVFTVPGYELTDWSSVWASIGLMVLAVAFSVAFSTTESKTHWTIIIPVISLMAIGVLRAGAGSLFTVVAILPLVWIASEEGRRWVVLAIVATAASLSLEATWHGNALTAGDMARTIFTPLVFGLAALVINEIARQSRKRIKANRILMEQRETMLAQAVEYVRQLRENERRLKAAEQFARSILDSVTLQAVIATNLTGLIDAWNDGAESMFGLPAEAVKGQRHISDFHDPDELEARARELNYPAGATVLNPGFSALVEKARLGGAEQHEWTWIRTDGTHFPVEVAVTPRVDEDGAVKGYIFLGTDITEQKEVAKLQDDFVGLVSHELRTPLTSILGYLELLREDATEPLSDVQKQYLAVAERNANRLLHLVGDLLFTAQVASDRFPIEIADVDLCAVIAASIDTARPSSQASNVLLLYKAASEPIIIRGDVFRLGQAVDNLLSNAIKFTPRGGTVTVKLDPTDDAVTISVKDTGVGIPADELSLLASRFFRASTATRNAVQGVGLGMSITKAIVTSHRGQLDVESEVGVGTTFRVMLPIRMAEDEHAA
ncbi:MAG TPA: ATP-binding protein [Homoserinimonas sp.]|nr:ATP-binding protein [Homoserinimonas sp.]